MNENIVKEIIEFVNTCDKSFFAGEYNIDYEKQARYYIRILKNNKTKNAIYRALMEKLEFIIKQTNSYYSNPLYLLNGVNSITEYISSLIKEKHLTDPKLIARYVLTLNYLNTYTMIYQLLKQRIQILEK